MLGFLQQLGGHLGAWFYLLAGGLAFAEAALMVGVIVPGETALLVAGFAARQGWIGLWPMVGVAVASAALGDTVGYDVGRRLGPRLRSSRLGRRIGARRWERADTFLQHHGGRAVFLGRFISGLRALTPGLAGMARMPYLRTFLPFNVAGAVVWGAGCVLLGYSFSASLATMGNVVTVGSVVVIALGCAVLALVKLRRLRVRRASRDDCGR